MGTRRSRNVLRVTAPTALLAAVILIAAACVAPSPKTAWKSPTAQRVGRVHLDLVAAPPTNGFFEGYDMSVAFPLGDGVAVLSLYASDPGAQTGLRLVDNDGNVTSLPVPDGIPVRDTAPPGNRWARLDGGRTAVVVGGGVAVFRDDGTLDPTMGDDGTITLPPALFVPRGDGAPQLVPQDPTDVAARPNGGLVVGSIAKTIDDVTQHDGLTAVTALDPSGAPDPGFGQDGTVELGFQYGRTSYPKVLLVSGADGSVTVVRAWWGGNDVARLRADGSVDPAFAARHLVNTCCYDYQMGVDDLQVDQAGRFVVASGQNIFRLLADGAPDLTFGPDGTIERPSIYVPGPIQLEPRSGPGGDYLLVNAYATGMARLLDDGRWAYGFAVPPATGSWAGLPAPEFRRWDWTPSPRPMCCLAVRNPTNGSLFLIGGDGPSWSASPLYVAKARGL